MDHHGDQPSWRTGTAAVSTGAGPPDLDAESDDERDGAQAYADSGSGDNGAAPGFGDGPAGQGFNDSGEPPSFDEAPPGFGDGPGPSSQFGAPAPAPEPFPGAASPSFGEHGRSEHGLGEHGQGEHGQPFGDEQQSFSPGPFGNGQPEFGDGAGSFGDAPQRDDYGNGYRGDFPGNFSGSGFGGERAGDSSPGHAQDGDSFGPPPAPARESFGGGPAIGGGSTIGGGPAIGGIYGEPSGGPGFPGGGPNGRTALRDDGPAQRDQGPPFTNQYRATEPPSAKARMTATLKAVRRPKSSKRDQSGRQAQLTVSRLEPWSVMKFSFVISVVAFIVLFVAVAVLYAILSGLGVFSTLQHTISNITSSQGSSGFNLSTYLSASRVLGYTGMLGFINVILITALSTVGAVLYNITADLAGGVEVTLKESD